MAGTKSCRGNWDAPAREPVQPSFVTSKLTPYGNPFGTKDGYHFQIFIPGPITDDGSTKALPVLPESEQHIINAQESDYRIYAWPVSFKSTGKRCFATGTSGEVFQAANTKGKGFVYSGATNTPAFDAAILKKDKDTPQGFEGRFVEKALGKDNQNWILVK